MPDKRNDKARERDEWLESDEGKKATEGSASGQYLHNRVENGFCSGWDAAMKQQDVEGLTKLRDSLANPNNLISYSLLGRGGMGALAENVVKCLNKVIAATDSREEEKLALDNALVQVEKSQKYTRQLIKQEHIPANLPDVYDGLGGALALAMKDLLGLQNRIGVPQR